MPLIRTKNCWKQGNGRPEAGEGGRTPACWLSVVLTTAQTWVTVSSWQCSGYTKGFHLPPSPIPSCLYLVLGSRQSGGTRCTLGLAFPGPSRPSTSSCLTKSGQLNSLCLGSLSAGTASHSSGEDEVSFGPQSTWNRARHRVGSPCLNTVTAKSSELNSRMNKEISVKISRELLHILETDL